MSIRATDGLTHIHLPCVDSTNSEALRLAELGQGTPFWLTADRQTAARGRRGKAWTSGHGNFMGTLVLDLPNDPAAAALRSFSMSLALGNALACLNRDADIALKWPNDVLIGGCKVAGILLEAVATPPVLRLRIGVGVNLAEAPDLAELQEGATRPAVVTGGIAPQTLLDVLSAEFDDLEHEFRAEGFEPIRRKWLARAAKLGAVVTARLPDRSLTGTFADIDASGALVLHTSDGYNHLPAAEVFF